MTAMLPLIYSCSGCSNSAQMCNDLAIKIDRESLAEMSCIAGIGGKVSALLKKAKSGRPIIALDGCLLKCCHETFKQNDISVHLSILLSDYQIKKSYHQDYSQEYFYQICLKLKSKIIETFHQTGQYDVI